MPCPFAVDSRMTFAEAVAGTTAPPAVIVRLKLAGVSYLSFDGHRHRGQLVVHEAVLQDILTVFTLMEEIAFPLAHAVPIVAYDWSDDASMAANNTSAFNYRVIAGTSRLSVHARGLAVDINPLLNPVIYGDGRVSPPDARYRPGTKGVLTAGCPVVQEFTRLGWQWGGFFASFKDYHHFEKNLSEDDSE